eukprot:TRINITY_DN18752_c1_g1_i1.p1 TRINITY_DN18752_c1_g1~~TRINITY_DN18752_c1_g1_i1.p1  ORF type:complete len:289 (+),score=49.58 TRINITY_DN18752_c1_g1_i1:43-909(+)
MEKKGQVAAVVGMGLLTGGFLYCLNKMRGGKKKALKGKEKIELQLIKIEGITHNTRVYTFALPDPDAILGLPIGNHVSASTKIDGKLVSRAYTPISSDVDVGVLKLAIKVYPDGLLTQHMDKMQISDTLLFSGPTGHFSYHGDGSFTCTKKPHPPAKQKVKSFAMLAGGTGITPCLQVMEAIHRDPTDKTKVYLLFANTSVDDILLRDKLEQLAAERPGQFHVRFTIDKAPEEWVHSSGRINEEMMRDHLGPVEDSLALMCGPPGMIKFACLPNLETLGWTKEKRFQF